MIMLDGETDVTVCLVADLARVPHTSSPFLDRKQAFTSQPPNVIELTAEVCHAIICELG